MSLVPSGPGPEYLILSLCRWEALSRLCGGVWVKCEHVWVPVWVVQAG